MLLDAKGIAVHLEPQEFRSVRDRLPAAGDQEFIDIGEDVRRAAICQEDVADKAAGTVEIMEGAGVELVGKASPENMFFHGVCSCESGCRARGTAG